MATQETDPEQAFHDAHAALLQAYDDATQAVEEIENPQQSFDRATELANDLRKIADDAPRLRNRAAVRIRDAERLSLAGLAQRISVSRARADQMIRAAANKPDPKEGDQNG
jgi:septation ring formation regulator EzrA